MRQLIAFSLVWFALVSAVNAQGHTPLCRATSQALKLDGSLQSKININGNTRTGEPTALSWQVSNNSLVGDLYLVIGFPSSTRFQGDGFVAIPPQARAPRSIIAQADKTRVIVPLTGSLKNPDGSADVMFFATGTKEIDWEVVELPSGISGPCVEKVHSRGTLSIQVTSGRPQFVTQDRFATGTPKSTYISNDSKFALLEFSDRYQLIDNQTGDLLVERSGKSSRFSHSGRYITSLGGSNRLEVLDVLAQRIVFTTDAGLEGNFGGVAVAAWMDNDALLVLGYGRKGAVGVTLPLIDDRNIFSDNISCNACHAFGSTSVSIDLDQLTFQAGNLNFADQAYASSLLEVADSLSTIKFWDEQKPEERGPPPRRPKYPVAHYDPVGRIGDQLRIPASKDQDDFFWVFSDEITVSFSEVWNGNVKMQRAFLASKTEKPKAQTPQVLPKVATHGKISKRMVEVAGTQVSPRNSLERLVRSLLPFKILINQSRPTNASRPIESKGNNDEKVSKSALAILQDGMATIAKNRAPLIFRSQANKDQHKSTFFAKSYSADLSACMHDEGPEEASQQSDDVEIENSPVISADQLVALWKFEALQGSLVVAQQYTQCGTAPDRYGELIAVFAPSETVLPIQYIRFAASYSDAGEVSDPSGIDATRSKSGASLRLDVGANILMTLVDGRWLIATSKDSGAAVVFDVPSMKRLYLVEKLENPLDIAAITMTTDHRTLVQMNYSGALSFYSLDSSKLSLRGRFVDEEMVLFDSALNYESTPEGASYVYVQVPGNPELFTLDQFSSKLALPGLGQKRIYEEALDSSPPVGITPPSLSVEKAESSFVVNTSSESVLSELSVAVDGYRLRRFALQGSAANQVVPFESLSEGRWVSFVVEDKQNIKSVTRAFQLSNKPYAGNLRVLSFGANKFNRAKLRGKTVPDLSFAAGDAKRFEAGLKQLISPSYSGYSARVLASDATSRDELLGAIRDFANSTKRGDTLILFFASHGATSNGQFRLVLPVPTQGADAIELPFSAVSEAISSSQGRVFIFLDACHSADATQDAASEQLADTSQNVTIISASKGPQSSLENKSWGGGIFTSAVLDAIAGVKSPSQTSARPTLSMEALYARVRKNVVSQTNGRQTPWFRRASWQGEQSIN